MRVLMALLLILLAAGPGEAQKPGRRKRQTASPTWPMTVAQFGSTLPAAGTVVDTLDGRPVYAAVEQMPTYPGGVEQLRVFLLRHLQYPPQYHRITIEGRLSVSFIVDRNGQVRHPALVRGLAEHCDAEALRVLALLPPFTAGHHHGRPVDVRYVLPLLFTWNAGWSFGPSPSNQRRR